MDMGEWKAGGWDWVVSGSIAAATVGQPGLVMAMVEQIIGTGFSVWVDGR